MKPICEKCGSTMTIQRHVSFVDCFGPDVAFAKLDGTTILAKDIVPKDQLLGPDGRVRTVRATKSGVKELYEVVATKTRETEIDRTQFTCTGGHLLCLRIDSPVESPAYDATKQVYYVRTYMGNSNGLCSTRAVFKTLEDAQAYYATLDKSPITFEMTVEAYLLSPASIRRLVRLYRADAMVFGEPALDLNLGQATEAETAWVLGVWLSGNSGNVSVFLIDETSTETHTRLVSLLTKMGITSHTQYTQGKAMVSIPSDTDLTRLMTSLSLSQSSPLSPALLTHSLEVRYALIAGLIDARGSLTDNHYTLTFTETEKLSLAKGVAWILRSLGLTTSTSSEANHQCIAFQPSSSTMLPLATQSKRSPSLDKLSPSPSSQEFTVDSIGLGEFYGFEVDGDGCVLLDDFTVAHNCPGHDILMATMLNGAAVMDAALLLIAGNEPCPQPQTSEHLAAVEIMKLKNIIILQNKIDLVKEKDAASQYDDIVGFVRGTVADGAPIVPISAQLQYNIEVVCEYICTKIPKPIRDFTSSPRLIVIRSFDVNHPGAEVKELVGGVAGGSILRGVLRMGQEIEIRPGIVTRDPAGNVQCIPMFSRIVSLFAEKNHLQYAVPGGLIGVGTKIDPTLTRADRLVGQVLGEVGQLPDIFTVLEISFFLLRRLLGVRTDPSRRAERIPKLSKGEMLMVNIGSTSTGARVIKVEGDLAKVVLTSPVCSSVGEKLALSRRVDKHWRLIGWGMIRKGTRISETSDASSGEGNADASPTEGN